MHNCNVRHLAWQTIDPTEASGTELRTERGVAQYQRLASLLRHRIAKGEYPLGAQLPPITQLADDLGVAVVTRPAGVRAAVQGRADPQPARCRHPRGRAARRHWRHRAGDQRSVRRAAGAGLRDPRDPAPHRRCRRSCSGRTTGRPTTTCACASCTPIPASRSATPRSTCRRRSSKSLPRDIARKRKLLAAVLDELGPRCKRVRQRMTVMPADFPVCDMLKIPFASPVAKMSRRLRRRQGQRAVRRRHLVSGRPLRLRDRLPRVRLEDRARHHRTPARRRLGERKRGLKPRFCSTQGKP